MLQVIAISEIKNRADAIGVSLQDLASEAGVHRSTAWRAVRGANISLNTARKLTRALLDREQKVLTALAELHPEMMQAAQ